MEWNNNQRALVQCRHCHCIPGNAKCNRTSRSNNSVCAAMGSITTPRNRPTQTKETIHQNIKRLLKQLKKEGNKMGKDKNGVSTVASDCDLIDVHTSRHNEAATTATYARGTKKIDYMPSRWNCFHW